MSGAPTFAVESRAQIQSEVQWLSISGTLVMSALLLLAFASPLALGVALLPVATGCWPASPPSAWALATCTV
jgi:predicted exporter